MAYRESARSRLFKKLFFALIITLTLIYLIPLFWISATAFKKISVATTVPPTVFFKPDVTPFIKLFTKRVELMKPMSQGECQKLSWFGKKIHEEGERIITVSPFLNRFLNSLVIASISTFLAVFLGTLAAYGFSRFNISGKDDWLFFILSTRMLPPVVVAIPVFLMFTTIGLMDTHLGLILLYTAMNVSFCVWLMVGFIDEIPTEYEEAALVDGYTRFQTFWKIFLPQSVTGIAVSSVFCFIIAWNEYALAMMMTNRNAQTAPAFLPSQVGSGMDDWTTIAAGTFLFLFPVTIFTFLLRKHLLRGVTFGAIRK